MKVLPSLLRAPIQLNAHEHATSHRSPLRNAVTPLHTPSMAYAPMQPQSDLDHRTLTKWTFYLFAIDTAHNLMLISGALPSELE